MYGLDYEERIKACEILKLSDRMVRKNLIQMFKILNNLDEINCHKARF